MALRSSSASRLNFFYLLRTNHTTKGCYVTLYFVISSFSKCVDIPIRVSGSGFRIAVRFCGTRSGSFWVEIVCLGWGQYKDKLPACLWDKHIILVFLLKLAQSKLSFLVSRLDVYGPSQAHIVGSPPYLTRLNLNIVCKQTIQLLYIMLCITSKTLR